jgi:hypothetical protein
MKKNLFRGVGSRLVVVSVGLVTALSSVSCMTTYDSYGRPMQTVDPGLAIAGVAAAGVLGYALANDNDNGHRHYNRHHRGGYYAQPSYGYGHRYHH